MEFGDETVCLTINTDTTPIHDLLQQKKKQLFLTFFGVLIGILGIGSGLTFSIVRPLSKLEQRALGVIREYSREDLSLARKGNEIATLSQAMEVMLAAIQGRLADLQQAQETIRERENFLASVFASIQEGLVVMDRDLTILRVNPAMERKFSQEMPLVGRKCYAAFHGYDQPCEVCVCREVMETGKASHRLRPHQKGDTTDWIEHYAFPLQDLATGRVTGVIEHLLNITEQKKAEEALRESEEKYRLLVNQIPAAVFRGYADWSVDTFDSKIETLTGYTKEDFDTRRVKWSQLILAEDLPMVQGKFLKALKTTGEYEREYRIRKKTGEIIWVQVQGRIFLDAAGRIDYVSGVIFDITARKRAEEALLKYKFMANTARECMTLIDRNYLYEAANTAFCQAHGKTREEVVGNSVANIWGEESFKIIKGYLDQCFAGQEVEFEGWFEFGAQGLGCYNVSYSPYFNEDSAVTYAAVVSHNITDRRQAEEAVRERESMLSLVINAVPQAVFWKDLNSVYLGCNQNYARALGLESPEAIMGKTEYDLPWKPEETEFYQAEDREVMETRQVKYHQIQTRQMADGRQIWVDGTKLPLLANDGTVMGLLGVYDDITERRKMEEELREREASYRTLAQNLPGLVYRHYLGENGTTEIFNDILQTMTGYSPLEISRRGGRCLNQLVLPEDKPKVKDAVKEAIAKNQVFECEYRFRHKDGSLRYFAERGKPIRGEDGEVSHIDGVVWDITESKKMEAAVQESERRFRGLVESVPMGIMILQDGEIVYQNPEQQRLFQHLQIQNCHDLMACGHQEDLAKVRQFCHGIRAHRSQAAITLRFLPLGGQSQEKRMIWLNCQAGITEYQGREAMLINMVDITHTKELEQLMLIREKMASLGQVAAGIAHEIRNPLSGINVFLDGIKENFQDPDSTEVVQELIAAAQATSNRIEAVIRRVLDFSRPTDLKLAPTNINEAVDNAIQLTASSLRKGDIRIDSSMAADLPLVKADRQLLEQALVNIITNAGEALRGAKEPGIIQVATRKAEEGVLIAVQDSGPGIPPGILDKIFDPFFTTKSDGSGIGLSLCHRIIADHQGTIEVSPSELGGTQFIIHLPGK
jgi:PAS domain S-box-containing protein